MIMIYTFMHKLLRNDRACHKKAFTLAEVLITLGIIGIVAAMTLPSIIQKNNNKVVETRLKKFYSAMNQAILMAENDYGDKKYWYKDLKGAQLDEDGKPIPGSSEQEKWFNKYLAPYLNILEHETLANGSYIVYFADGGALQLAPQTTRDYYFYPGKPKKCLAKNKKSGNWYQTSGICMFVFNFNPAATSSAWEHHYNKGMEPFKADWNGKIEMLKSGSVYSCTGTYTGNNNHYCTAIIQMNNWKIPDDYPFKVSY